MDAAVPIQSALHHLDGDRPAGGAGHSALDHRQRKRLGPLLDYFKPVTVLAGDATPGRESLVLAPASGVDMSAGAPVVGPDGLLVGRLVEGRRVRLVTDKDFTLVGQFGRWENGNW